jgi:hypothetical protein
MRRNGAGTSHRVPDRGISIGPGAITTGGPADPIGTVARHSATRPRRGGLSGTIGTMIGAAPASQTRIARPEIAIEVLRGGSPPVLTGLRPAPPRPGPNRLARPASVGAEACRPGSGPKCSSKVSVVQGRCAERRQGDGGIGMHAGGARHGGPRQEATAEIASTSLRGRRRGNQPLRVPGRLGLSARVGVLLLGPASGRSCLVQLRVGRRGAEHTQQPLRDLLLQELVAEFPQRLIELGIAIALRLQPQRILRSSIVRQGAGSRFCCARALASAAT